MAAKGAALPEDHRLLREGQAVGARNTPLQGVVPPLREEGLRLREAERRPQEGGQPLREGHFVLGGRPQARPRVLQSRVLWEIVRTLSQGKSSIKIEIVFMEGCDLRSEAFSYSIFSHFKKVFFRLPFFQTLSPFSLWISTMLNRLLIREYPHQGNHQLQ